MASDRVCLGAIAGAHGVRGQVRIKAFTEVDDDVTAYGPLSDEAGQRHFKIAIVGRSKGNLLARIEGVTDRNQAEALRGTRLYVDRAALPAPEDEETFYHADLIGLLAVTEAGAVLGRVRQVHNFGAGDLLELAPEGDGSGVQFLPFTKAVVPAIDLTEGRLTVVPPPEVEVKPEPAQEPPDENRN